MTDLIFVVPSLLELDLILSELKAIGYSVETIEYSFGLIDELSGSKSSVIILAEEALTDKAAWKLARKLILSEYKSDIGLIILVKSLNGLNENSDLYSSKFLDVITCPFSLEELVAHIVAMEEYISKNRY
ncbi:MAG: hypothetical protein K8L91_27620 [Anaerolineae bacterium]|nr:hypothetical protein [Anaerolineae bacterium]